MELEIMYPEIITLSIIIVLIIFWIKKDKMFKSGIVVANTKYIKNTKYYKKIMNKYRVYKILINIFCILLIIVCSLLTSRIHSLYKVGETINNRDIVLCMDISGSVNSLNANLVKTMKTTVSSLKNERIGITVFDSMPLSLVPLTNDYKYVLSVLDQIDNGLKTKFNPFEPNKSSYTRDLLYNGVQQIDDKGRGYSLVGDGLAYCASSFNDDNQRTKIIILTTDDDVVGQQLVTVPEAASLCQKENIHIYAIGTKEISLSAKSELEDISKYTNGKYYDYANYSTNDIAKEINSLSSSVNVKSTSIYTKDYPEKMVYIILVILPLLIFADTRVRI